MKWLGFRWRLFVLGIAVMAGLVALEYASGGWLPGASLSLLIVGGTLVAEKAAQPYYGTSRYPQVYLVVILLQAIFWWYVATGVIDAVRRRRSDRADARRAARPA